MFLCLAAALWITGCGQQAESSETIEKSIESIVAEVSAEEEVQAEETDADDPMLEEPGMSFAERLEMAFGPDKEDEYAAVTAVYTGAEQVETDYIIWDIAAGATVSQQDMDRVDRLCRYMEEITGMTFFGGKYSPDKKITIHLSKTVDRGYADETEKSICLDESCLARENFAVTIHELVHILEYADCCYLAYPFYMEGFAEYETYRIGEQIVQSGYDDLAAWIDLDGREALWRKYSGNTSTDSIFEQDIYHWMEKSCFFEITDSWPAYVYGRYFFAYLEDVYGDAGAWLQAAAKVPNVVWADDEPGLDNRYFFVEEDMRRIMTVTYDADVFEKFYPWLSEHQDFYEQYK